MGRISKIQKKQEVKKEEIPTVKDGNVMIKKRWAGLRWRDKRKFKKKGDTAFYIKMFFSNGTSKEFVIATPHETFQYNKRTYYLMKENIVFNLTQNQYELIYLDDFSTPINIKEIRREGNEAFFSVTPDNLKPLIDMNYVKVLASSEALNKWLRMGAVLSFIVLMLSMYIMLKVVSISRLLTAMAGG